MASAALICSFRFRPYFARYGFHQASTSAPARQLSTAPNGGASAASPATTEGTSVTPAGSSSRTALDVAVPSLSSYKHLLIKRHKHPMLYDSEAKGFLG